MLNKDYIRVLEIDLTNQHVGISHRKDLYDYLGGTGVAAKLLEERISYDGDPLAPSQPIIFAIGPMTMVFPVVCKAVAAFRSPQTGDYGESHAGGRLGMAMCFSGYDAVTITGRSPSPVYLSIHHHGVEFRNAGFLEGRTISEIGRLIRQREVKIGAGKRSIMRIGPAGENGVRFACVNVDSYRHFGRLGLGASMGSKNLKAVVIGGTQSYPIARPKEYNAIYNQIYRTVTESPAMQKYHELGTPQNVLPLNVAGALPTRNLQESQFAEADRMSGESFARELLLRKIACSGCPVGCIHMALLREQFGEGYEYKYSEVNYDYEPIYSFGTMLGIGNKHHFLSLMAQVEELGLDAMTTGVLLAWATEAQEKGLISEKDLGVKLVFGDVQGYTKAMENIVKGGNDLYKTLGLGLAAAVKKYGGEDFACLTGGLEMAGYHTGYAHLIGQSVGARQSHLDNAGYSIDQSAKDYNDTKKVAEAILKEEKERCMLTSLSICLFARNIYKDRSLVAAALHSLGIDMNEEKLGEIGRKIFELRIGIKRKCGFKYEDLTFARRFFETPSLHGVLSRETMKAIMDEYLKLLPAAPR